MDDAVTHVDGDGLSAVETGGFDAHRFPRKQPADRQRLESSLGKPLLLALYGDAKLGGLIVEGGKGGDKIRLWIEPTVNT